ncbi:MAG: hypothetical protein M1587_00575 [Thaumarchaeota archaeon]|nr:hypothetical protein [Nitrososphaerota archaeon]
MQQYEGFVAMADVLGFKTLTEKQDNALVLANQYKNFLTEVLDRTRAVLSLKTGVGDEKRVGLEIQHQVFSDTLLLWLVLPVSDGISVQQKLGDPMSILFQLELFFKAIPFLILVGLQHRFPLRIGIAYGKCVIEPDERVYVGQAIVDAHEMEQSQQWMEVAYHKSCVDVLRHNRDFVEILDDLKEFGYLCEYQVPPKPSESNKEAKNKLTWTTNWPILGLKHFHGLNILTRCEEYRDEAIDKTAKQKWENTLKYYSHCHNPSV